MPSVGIVVPAYRPNAERLRAYLRDLRRILDPAALRVELDAPSGPVTDLGSAPATVNVVRRRRGKGAAITAGFEALAPDVDVLSFVDADGATPARSLDAVLDPVLTDEADLATGSRRHPDAEVQSHQTLGRRLLGDAFAWTARRLLDAKLYDYQCGAKALTTPTWRLVRPHLYEPGFAWDIELVAVAAALDCRIREVPIAWKDQPGSTVSPLGDAFDMGRGLLIARHRARLLQEDRLHSLLDSDAEPTALVDRSVEPGTENDPR